MNINDREESILEVPDDGRAAQGQNNQNPFEVAAPDVQNEPGARPGDAEDEGELHDSELGN